MPLTSLYKLLEKAEAARLATGPQAAAQRLMLFGEIANALQFFIEREQQLAAAKIGVISHVRWLNAALQEIQMAPRQEGPTSEQVSQFYTASARLRSALTMLERTTTVVDARAPLEAPDDLAH
jgi:hypothetical protein